jgi:phenylacetyl-CoA:acceptor oxidoreductase subunit 1
MARWIMVIDLEKCNGCERCVAFCTGSNELPAGIAWRKVATAEVQNGSIKRRLFVPMSCMHCGDPPCRDVCPTGATHQYDDGIVDIDHQRCIGCGYCVVACPYLARSMVTQVAANNSGCGSRSFAQGVATKCDMCRSKVQNGVAQGLVPGRDAEATPGCVAACLWNAIHFGDADDPDSNVSVLLRNNQTFRLNEQLGTEPSIYYLNAETGSQTLS